MTSQSPGSWWGNFFDDAFGKLYLERHDDPELEEMTGFLLHKLGLQAGQILFDQCCGTGAIAAPFAKKAIHVIGVDQAPHYIQQAKERIPSGKFYVADAFSFLPEEKCDAAINWATSFGYLPDDRKNIAMLQRIFESLKPGGRFAFEYSNGAADIRNFKPQVEYRQILADGELYVTRDFYIDLARGMRGSYWSYHYPNGDVQKRSGESRLYMPSDIAAMLVQCGFIEIEIMADYHHNPVTIHSPRFICIASKPLHAAASSGVG